MKIEFTEEKRGEIQRIQQAFEKELSPKEILKGTAQAINSTLSRSLPRINKDVKDKYNIQQKYLSRQSLVSPKAHSGKLYGGIRINEAQLPIIAFKPKQAGSNITVMIHKGKRQIIRNSFIATMASGHKGVFARGRYTKKSGFEPGREKTRSGKIRITELRTASVFKMGVSPEIAQDVQGFMGNEVTARVHGILTSRVAKIAAQNQ